MIIQYSSITELDKSAKQRLMNFIGNRLIEAEGFTTFEGKTFQNKCLIVEQAHYKNQESKVLFG